MSIVVVLILWGAAALIVALAFAFGAAVGRQRAYEEAAARFRRRGRLGGRRGPQRTSPALGPHRWRAPLPRDERRVRGSR